VSIESRLRQGLDANAEAVPVDAETSLNALSRRTTAQRRRRVVVLAAAAAAGVTVLVPTAAQWFADEPAPASPAGRDLVGTYLVEVSAPSSQLTGRWTVTIAADGRMVLDPPPGLDDRADTVSYAVANGVLETNALLSDCQGFGSSVVGRYTWVQRTDLVLFTLVEDPCSARRALFDSEWMKVQPQP
jgi:hypothetical protein